jgi:hypothetical protein
MSRSEYLVLQLRAELERVTAERDELRRLTRNGRRCDECMESKIAVDELAKVTAERDRLREEKTGGEI